MATKRGFCSLINAQHLRKIYRMKRKTFRIAHSGHVNPRDVFCNNIVPLKNISVYGFDYDYTLAVYTHAVHKLIYKMVINRLVNEHKYPSYLDSLPYDPKFAIRGLHYDVKECCLLKIDAFSQIQEGTVYRGRKKLSFDEIMGKYGSFSLTSAKVRTLIPLVDLFTLPWAGLLSTTVQYFDENSIDFDPLALYQDVKESVNFIHNSGELHDTVNCDLKKYLHKNVGLELYLKRITGNGKKLFLITNSPYSFVNQGMMYMLGADWRDYFEYIVVLAKKPYFFQTNAPFRLCNEDNRSFSYEMVSTLKKGLIYSGGNIGLISKQPIFVGNEVLYFGDHLYTDLADPILNLGWHTAAIVPELAREIRLQNNYDYQEAVCWTRNLTLLIEKYESLGENDTDVAQMISAWMYERNGLRDRLKTIFNPQFGSMFRTYHNMSFFSRRLNRLANLYTSRLPNMLNYSDEHTFFARRNALPHEAVTLEMTHFTGLEEGASLSYKTDELPKMIIPPESK